MSNSTCTDSIFLENYRAILLLDRGVHCIPKWSGNGSGPGAGSLEKKLKWRADKL